MENHTFLVIIDAHSKWLEVIPMHSTSATATIQALRTTFSQLGLPETIVSDNGPQFSASEFSQFCHLNGIRHIRVPITLPQMGLRNMRCRRLRKVLRSNQRAQFETDFLASYLLIELLLKHPLEYLQRNC